MKLALVSASLLLIGAFWSCPVSAAEKEEPSAPQPPESRPSTRSHDSGEDRQRFMNLSEAARTKFIDAMREAREKMGAASAEERQVLVKKIFEKIEAEDQAGKLKPAPPENTAVRERHRAIVSQAQPASVVNNGIPLRNSRESKMLPQNYRVSITGKEGDKTLGSLTSLTCANAIVLDGTLDSADAPMLINLSGNFDDQDGSITFSYSIGFNVPVKTASLLPGNGGNAPLTTINYKTQTCQGALRMRAGKSYEVLKAGGITYSVSIAPEPDK